MIVSSASWLHGRGLWLGFAAFASVMPGVRFAAVSGADAPKPNAAVLQATEQQALRGVLTRDQQALLTPQAVILSCLDSRIPVEDVFDRGIGDIFVARVAGNFVNEDILGSMEFACHVAGARLIMVLGHTHCGAVKAAIDDVRLGNITPMLAKIRPAIERGRPFEGRKASDNPAYVAHVCRENVRLAVEAVRERSEILRKLEADGAIKIVGAYYDLGSGEVSLLP